MTEQSWNGLFYCLQLVVILTGTAPCHAVLCPLTTANCSQFDVTCTVHLLTSCSNLGQPELDGSTNSYPGPVTSFQVRTEIQNSSMEIMWKLPKYESYRYLSGFGIKLTSTSDFDEECFVYNISSAMWSGDLSKYKFVHYCTHLKKGQYTVDVITLPKSDASDVKMNAIVRVQEWDTDCNRTEASCWKTDIVVYSRPCDKLVNVTFHMAPDETGITSYLVTLIFENSFVPDTSVNVTHVRGERAGYATLNISEIELPLSNRLIMVKPEGKVCELNNCPISVTKSFDIPEPTEKDCVFDYGKPLEPHLSKAFLALTIIGSIVLALTAVALFLIATKYRYGCVARKSLYIVYSNDNQLHQQVIEHFVDYLSSVCSCEVINGVRDADLEHERSECASKMRSCDNIVVVTSEGSHRRSWMHDVTGFDDVFSTAYRIIQQDAGRTDPELKEKLILVHFGYTQRQYASLPIPYLNGANNYLLMEEAKSLYRRIHRLSRIRLLGVSLGCNEEMLTSINDAIRYPDWHIQDGFINPLVIEESIGSSSLDQFVDDINML